MAKQALRGVRVVELGDLAAGPYCGKLLADLGAEVIKVETPGSGDGARARGPFFHDIPHPEHSGLFLYLNTNKLGVTLDVRLPSGREVFRRLVRDADVLVEDRAPGELDRLGLGYESLRRDNPRLVVTSITPFGQTGPYSHYKAYPLNTFHAGGEGYTLPGSLGYALFPDREPLKLAGYFGEYIGGLTAAIATVCALYGRDAAGGGQHIDVSRQEALMALSRVLLARYPNEEVVEARAVRELPIGGLMPCQDGFVEVMAFEPRMWEGLVDLMGHPSWTEEERYKNAESRVAHKKEVNARIEEWLKGQTKERVYHEAQARDCAVGPVYTVAEAMASAQTQARGFLAEIEHPVVGRLPYPTVSYKLSETPWRATRPAPLLGQHNEEVYCGRLGMRREELVQLREAGVI